MPIDIFTVKLLFADIVPFAGVGSWNTTCGATIYNTLASVVLTAPIVLFTYP